MPTDDCFTSRIVLTRSALIGTATAIGLIGLLTVEDPVALFANVKTLLLEKAPLQPGPHQSTAASQSAPGPEYDLPATTQAPTHDQIATDQSQTKISQPSTEGLFKQFQAWAVDEDKRAQVGPMEPAQDPLVQDDRPNLRIMTEPQVWPVHDVPIRSRQNPRKKVLRAQNARVRVRLVQDARAQVRPVQNAPALSLPQSLGLRN
jgi:hypothetical protein